MRAVVCTSLLFCAVLGSCASKPPPKPKKPRVIEPCDGFQAKVDAVWNDRVLDNLDLTVKVYNSELDASDAEQIVGMLDAFSERWVTRRQTACQEHNEPDTLSDNSYKKKVKCLEAVLSGFGGRVDRFNGGDTKAFESLMFDLDDCS